MREVDSAENEQAYQREGVMNGLFAFVNDIGNYEDRKVARDDFKWGFISTARVSDGRKPFETAIKHPNYNKGSMVIVESYLTKQEALKGHAKWKTAMTGK